MNVMIRRSIGLSTTSAAAWKEAGGWFTMRTRSMIGCLELLRGTERNHQPIINLGDTTFNPTKEQLEAYRITGPLFNHGDDIREIVQPGPTRKLLGEFMPLDPRTFSPVYWDNPIDVWIKAPGQAGQGKTLLSQVWGTGLPQIPGSWDMQMHVTGQEYRVITVDLRVVQVSERFGKNGERTYRWIGVRAAPVPVKEIAREAARRLKGRNIIGWDIIQGDEPNSTYILEGNSSPGVNAATVRRIFDMIGDSNE